MFVHPYEKANLESFLEGPVRAFEYFGGVPRRSAYDHLKGAVIYVGQGKNRRRTKRFQERRAWYLFETRFCNIAKGNEKGDVENGGKRSERTYLSPEPRVDSLGQLASQLFDDGRQRPESPRSPSPWGQDGRRAVRRGEVLPVAEHLFGFFRQCYEQTSLIVTTNLPFADWPQGLANDERLAGALLDRLTHHVHILEIVGDSYRLKASLDQDKKRQE